jgi:hypothetical protein
MSLDGVTPFLIVIVPLIAGLLLLLACAAAIIRNPAISNTNAFMLGIGGLLCVAPALASFSLTGPGIKIEGVRSQVSTQGAEIKRDLDEIHKLIADVAKAVNTPLQSPVAAGNYAQNKETVVLILYSQPRKELARKIEKYLLGKGYSANAIYTDFTELSETSRGKEGTVSFIYLQQKHELADKIKADLRSYFPDLRQINDSVTEKLMAADLQIRLF